MSRWFYTILFYLLLPAVLLRLCHRAIKAPAYRYRIAERFGIFPRPNFSQPCIWVHAVSVGETIAAAPMIKALLAQHPDTPIVVTTMTPTGSQQLRSIFGDSVFHVYAPYDLPDAIGRFLKRVKPCLAIVLETELWPNTVYACWQQHIPLLVANARLSEKSARGYRRLAGVTQPMLQQLCGVVAQSESDRERFLALGLAPERCTVSGSIKFDISISDELQRQAQLLKHRWSNKGQRLVLMAASTHEGEDEQILAAFSALLDSFPGLLLVLVPRHPERFDSVAVLAEQQHFRVQRYSQEPVPAATTQIFIGDAMGQLLLWYGCADMVFVGGSLVDHGGHNMLEPAAWGLPIISGDSVYNFQEISDLLTSRSAMEMVKGAKEMQEVVATLINQPEQRSLMGQRAQQVMAENRGALQRLLDVVNQYLV